MLYLYNEGLSLRQYCIKNKYDYQTLRRYLMELKLPFDEAVELYKKNKGRHDTKCIYFIGDISLKNYCRKHNYKYGTIRNLIVNKGLSPKEAVKHYKIYKDKQNAKNKKTSN